MDIDSEFRIFGAFHPAELAVGTVNEDESSLLAWSNLDIRPDGTLTRHGFVCTAPNTWEYQWEPADGGAIRVLPSTPRRPSGEFDWGFDAVLEVTIRPDVSSCDTLSATVEYLDPERPGATDTYVSGGLCPDGEECRFELVWCEDQAPQPCASL